MIASTEEGKRAWEDNVGLNKNTRTTVEDIVRERVKEDRYKVTMAILQMLLRIQCN